MDSNRKIVLVTGSTDGVGRLVARRLADQGARVLIHGRDRHRGKQVVDQIQAAGHGSAVFLPADLSSFAEVRHLADMVRQNCDRLNVLINNAGIGSGGSAGTRETSLEGFISFCSRDPAPRGYNFESYVAFACGPSTVLIFLEVSANVGCPSLGFGLTDSLGFRR